MYEGKEFRFDGIAYTVPGLSLAALRRLEADKKIEACSMLVPFKPTVEGIDAAIEVVYEAVRRNHNSVTREQIADMVDTRNVRDLILHIFNLTGLREKKEGEASSPSTGAPSTAG